ncbi:hypothetical protein BC628DRAFT_210551 [Trametes gibbosa]|nr:hypothetical protein BC628DRAFT_210551 [Trametes gibbosa]
MLFLLVLFLPLIVTLPSSECAGSSWPSCAQPCVEANIREYNSGCQESVDSCICLYQPSAISMHGCVVNSCTKYSEWTQAEAVYQTTCAVNLDVTSSASSKPTPSSATHSIDPEQTGTGAGGVQVQGTATGRSHAMLPKTTILALSISLGGVVLFSGCAVFLCIWRRSRAGAAASSQSRWKTLGEEQGKEHEDHNLQEGSSATPLHAADEGRGGWEGSPRSYRANRETGSMCSIATSGISMDALESQEASSTAAQDGSSTSREDAGGPLNGTGKLEKAEWVADARRLKHGHLPPIAGSPTHANVRRGPPHSQTSLEPLEASMRSSPDTVLLRLPVEVAQQVLAAMADGSCRTFLGGDRSSAESQETESLPGYESSLH